MGVTALVNMTLCLGMSLSALPAFSYCTLASCLGIASCNRRYAMAIRHNTSANTKKLKLRSAHFLYQENVHIFSPFLGIGKIFHPGSSSGGPARDEGGADMPYSWSEPYFFCDQFTNDTVQSTAMQHFPNGTGCVQSQACIQVGSGPLAP